MPNNSTVSEAQSREQIVLVVEDEPLIRIATAGELRERGFKVFEACNADEAVRVLAAMRVDVVFSDITMPGSIDGVGLAKWVRQHKPATRIVLTSGKSHLPSEASHLGPLVLKPYLYDDVATRLHNEMAVSGDRRSDRSALSDDSLSSK